MAAVRNTHLHTEKERETGRKFQKLSGFYLFFNVPHKPVEDSVGFKMHPAASNRKPHPKLH